MSLEFPKERSQDTDALGGRSVRIDEDVTRGIAYCMCRGCTGVTSRRFYLDPSIERA